MKKHLLLLLGILLSIIFIFTKTGTDSEIADKANIFEYENAPEDDILDFELDTIQNLLFGNWKIICPYTVLPSAFDFNQYDSFEKYENILDDPIVNEIIEPYNEKLLDEIVKISQDKFIMNDIERLINPEYKLQKRSGGIYNDSIFWRYRPFHDYFGFDDGVYFYFEAVNYEENETDFFSICPRGFIVSYDYIVCPAQDDWIFYILKRQLL